MADSVQCLMQLPSVTKPVCPSPMKKAAFKTIKQWLTVLDAVLFMRGCTGLVNDDKCKRQDAEFVMQQQILATMQ